MTVCAPKQLMVLCHLQSEGADSSTTPWLPFSLGAPAAGDAHSGRKHHGYGAMICSCTIGNLSVADIYYEKAGLPRLQAATGTSHTDLNAAKDVFILIVFCIFSVFKKTEKAFVSVTACKETEAEAKQRQPVGSTCE